MFNAQIKILEKSGVMCNNLMWAKAEHSSTAPQFVRTLLLSIFDTETLFVSSLKRENSKRDPGTDKKKALDDNNLRAIYSEFQHQTVWHKNYCKSGAYLIVPHYIIFSYFL